MHACRSTLEDPTDAQQEAAALDATLDYVLTLRMRPVKVRLRLLAAPGAAMRYVLVQRS